MEGRRNGGEDAVEESEGKEWTWSNADERNILIWKRIELLKKLGVPIVAQWLTNLSRNHEVAGSLPALAQWIMDLVLPWAVV